MIYLETDKPKSWAQIYLADKIKYLEDLIMSGKGLEDKDKILDTIETMECLWDENEQSLNPKPLKELAVRHKEVFKGNSFLFEYFFEYLLNQDIWCTRPRQFFELSDNDLIELVHDFFRESLDKKLYQTFSKCLKRRGQNIYFHNLMGFREADCIYLDYFKEVLIRVYRKDDIDDVASLAHEFGHGIQFMENYSTDIYSRQRVFIEIVSSFFEILSLEYLKGFDRYKDSAISKAAVTFNKSLDQTSDVILEHEILDDLGEGEFQKGNKYFEQVLNGKIEEAVGKSLRSIIKKGNIDGMMYSIGYLIAIELFVLYKYDREKALDVLKRLIRLSYRMSSEEYFKNIQSLGLNPCSHIEEYKSHIITPKNRIF